MKSHLFYKLARWLTPVVLVFGLYVFTNAARRPGGGFASGLITAALAVLLGLSTGLRHLREAFRALYLPVLLTGLGLMLAVGLLALPGGGFLLEQLHGRISVLGALELELGSSMLFELGALGTVTGSVLYLIGFFSQEELS